MGITSNANAGDGFNLDVVARADLFNPLGTFVYAAIAIDAAALSDGFSSLFCAFAGLCNLPSLSGVIDLHGGMTLVSTLSLSASAQTIKTSTGRSISIPRGYRYSLEADFFGFSATVTTSANVSDLGSNPGVSYMTVAQLGILQKGPFILCGNPRCTMGPTMSATFTFSASASSARAVFTANSSCYAKVYGVIVSVNSSSTVINGIGGTNTISFSLTLWRVLSFSATMTSTRLMPEGNGAFTLGASSTSFYLAANSDSMARFKALIAGRLARALGQASKEATQKLDSAKKGVSEAYAKCTSVTDTANKCSGCYNGCYNAAVAVCKKVCLGIDSCVDKCKSRASDTCASSCSAACGSLNAILSSDITALIVNGVCGTVNIATGVLTLANDVSSGVLSLTAQIANGAFTGFSLDSLEGSTSYAVGVTTHSASLLSLHASLELSGKFTVSGTQHSFSVSVSASQVSDAVEKIAQNIFVGDGSGSAFITAPYFFPHPPPLTLF